MSLVYFISDLHFGHKRICEFSGKYRGNVQTLETHDQWIIDQWNSVVKKRDIVYVLGDVAMSMEGLEKVALLNGTKILIRGNHDEFKTEVYLKYFKEVLGFARYKGYWLSHCPIHPIELRDRQNIHGHVHYNTIPDKRYINVCVEPLGGIPIKFLDIKEKYNV